MNIKIIACGNMGATLKAGNMLGKMIDGAEVFDGKTKFDLSADIYVLGTNVHFGKFNKRFLKLAKKLKGNSKIFVYIVGAEIEKAQHYIERARDIVTNATDIRYVWGELNLEGATGLKRFAVQSFIDGRKNDGLPKPRILEKELRLLSQNIQALILG